MRKLLSTTPGSSFSYKHKLRLNFARNIEFPFFYFNKMIRYSKYGQMTKSERRLTNKHPTLRGIGPGSAFVSGKLSTPTTVKQPFEKVSSIRLFAKFYVCLGNVMAASYFPSLICAPCPNVNSACGSTQGDDSIRESF